MSNSIYNKDKTLPNFAQVGYEEWKKKQEAKNKAANIDPLDGIDPGGAKAGYDGVYDKLPKAMTEQKPAAPATATPEVGYATKPTYDHEASHGVSGQRGDEYWSAEDNTLVKADGTKIDATTALDSELAETTAAPSNAMPSLADYGLSYTDFAGFTYNDFQQSETYKNALAYNKSLLDKINTGTTSYTSQITELMNQIKGREEFSYDASNDVLFQQMLASSMNSGQMAMADSMGQAAALTGGYGNTYGQAVGNAAYNQYISEAYNNLPQYYGLALDAYNAEGDQMLAELAMLQDADATEYSRLVDAYNANVNAANDMYSKEYTEYLNKRNAAETAYWNNIGYKFDLYNAATDEARDERDFNYRLETDKQSQDNWEATFNYEQERDEKADERQMAQDLLGLTGGGSEVNTLSYEDLENITNVYIANGGKNGKGNEAVYSVLSLMGLENIDLEAMDEFLESIARNGSPVGDFINLFGSGK